MSYQEENVELPGDLDIRSHTEGDVLPDFNDPVLDNYGVFPATITKVYHETFLIDTDRAQKVRYLMPAGTVKHPKIGDRILLFYLRGDLRVPIAIMVCPPEYLEHNPMVQSPYADELSEEEMTKGREYDISVHEIEDEDTELEEVKYSDEVKIVRATWKRTEHDGTIRFVHNDDKIQNVGDEKIEKSGREVARFEYHIDKDGNFVLLIPSEEGEKESRIVFHGAVTDAKGSTQKSEDQNDEWEPIIEESEQELEPKYDSSIREEAGGITIEHHSGAAISITKEGEIFVLGKSVAVKASEKVSIESAETIDIRAKGDITITPESDIKIEGEGNLFIKTTGAVEVESEESAMVKAPRINIDSGEIITPSGEINEFLSSHTHLDSQGGATGAPQ